MKTENTSKRVATISGRMSRKIQKALKEAWIDGNTPVLLGGTMDTICTIDELQAVLSSNLTQAKDKPKKVKKSK